MKKILVLALMLSVVSSYAQDVKMKGSKVWATLADVKYEIEKDEYGDVYVPVFGKDILSIKDQIVEVEGFIIPSDITFTDDYLILSSLPISECFFCGSGGPETVMEVRLKKDERYKYNTKRLKFRGKLTLNTDPDNLMYQLVEGEFLGLADDSY
ncbi:hypothetical protein [Roseivirga sp.]|uniref:hypothetical protein n=1 Tax=Roseivirga sp. TaxID=1964215 RepID=UPI003B522A3F